MRVNGRPTDLMADSEAETGVGTRSGSTLDPARMTAAERKAVRDAAAAETKRLKEEADAKAEKEAREKRLAELKAERENRIAKQAEERAASDPMLDPTNRPDAPPADDEYVYYYSWIGGVSTGRWKLYRERKDSPKAVVAEARSEGGPTAATFSSSVGANTLASNIPGSTTLAPGATTTLAPGATTTLAPGATTTLAPGATTTLAPGATTTLAPGATTTLAPGATTTVAPGGTTTVAPATTTTAPGKTVVSTYTDPNTGDIYSVYSDGSRVLLSKGTKNAEQAAERRSAFQLLRDEFTRYGLQDLVGDVENLVISGVSPQEFAIELRKTPVYAKRFAANKARVAKGLQALSEAEYISLEDEYQERMRRYGLPKSYYEPGQYGVQSTFEKLLENDISPIELEDRIQTAQNRVLYANPEVGIALRTFYPDITNGDVLAYMLDPDKALAQIKRRVTAAEIGATAVQLGLDTNVTDAEYLARYGVTKDQAQQGFRNVAEVLPRASQLGDIYGKQGMGPYTQATATQEFFNVPGAAEAAAKRRKLAELETAQFSGQAGTTGGALARERAGQF